MANTQKRKSDILKGKFNTLARLFGAQSGTKVGIPCSGKWKGTTDYSVKFNNGVRFYISNGMKYFEKNLDEEIKAYSAFESMKSEIIEALQAFEAHDNQIAVLAGLSGYHVLDIDYLKSGDYLGWFYVIVDINGERHTVKETGLHFLIHNALKAESTVEIYREAEELKQETVFAKYIENPTFVFHNYAFSFDSYTADNFLS